MKIAGRLMYVLVLVAAAVVYGFLGFVQIQPDERGVTLLLGRYNRTLGPGLRWHAFGIEQLERRQITVQREEFGYRTVSAEPPQEYEERPEERGMLTGDANIAEVQFVVQWRVTNLADHLFNVSDPTQVIRDASQAAIREVVAQRPIDDVIIDAKAEIQIETKARLQELLDLYGAGVNVESVQLQETEAPVSVRDAFRDVASAQQDRERAILEAQGFRDQIVPRARGEKEAALNQARGYKERRVLEATGESDRFLSLLTEYKRAPDVTRDRLYIETLEQILPGMEKVIIESGSTENVLPYIPLGRRGVER